MADESADLVQLICVRERGKLRVRIVTAGYNHQINCRFPRNVRSEGRLYTAPSNAVQLKRGTAGTFFYTVSARDVSIVENAPEEAAKLEKLYYSEDDPEECVVCYTREKDVAFVPCGHFCCCAVCYVSLGSKCPLCRARIVDVVSKHDLDLG